MKQLTSYNRVAGYLNKMFDMLNVEFFESALSRPTITIQSTPRAYGHFSLRDDTWVSKLGGTHEINIGAGTLDRPIENITATLLHEMVHLHNMQTGVQDTSRGGQYHNKKFRDAATARDLAISYDSRIGWSITEPTEALIDFIISQGWGDIKMNREGGYTSTGGPGKSTGAAGIGTAPRRTSSTRKVWCPCCGQSVRATRHVSIICGICHIPMIEEGA